MNSYDYPAPLRIEEQEVRLRPAGEGLTLQLRLSRMRRAWRRIALWVAACVGLALIYCLLAPQEYLVTTQVALEPRQPSTVTDLAAQTIAPNLDSALADSQVQVLQSERNLRYVFNVQNLAADGEFAKSDFSLLGWLFNHLPFLASAPLTPEAAAARAQEAAYEAFASQVSVKRLAQSYAFEIAFYANDPQKAVRIGNAITAAYIRDKMLYNIAAAAAQRGGDFLQNRIDDTRAERDAIESAVRTGVIPDVVFGHADARIISTAQPPLKKTYPRTSIILALAASLSLLTGLGAVFVIDEIDRRPLSAARLHALVGLTARAELPLVKAARRDPQALLNWARTVPQSRFAMEMRKLRVTALRSGDGGAPAIGVIARRRGEGASVVAANLAGLLSESVGPTALVDANLAAPSLSLALCPDADRGLADCAAHALDPEAMLQQIDGRLSLLASGATSASTNPPFAALKDVLAKLARTRLVVVDLAPFDDGAESLVIARTLAGVIVVADAGEGAAEDVRNFLSHLEEHGVRVLGLALNKTNVS